MWRVINRSNNVIVWERCSNNNRDALEAWVNALDFDVQVIQVLIGFSPLDLWVEKRRDGRWISEDHITDVVDVYDEAFQ